MMLNQMFVFLSIVLYIFRVMDTRKMYVLRIQSIFFENFIYVGL